MTFSDDTIQANRCHIKQANKIGLCRCHIIQANRCHIQRASKPSWQCAVKIFIKTMISYFSKFNNVIVYLLQYFQVDGPPPFGLTPIGLPHMDYPHLDYSQLDYPHLDYPHLD